MAIAVDTLDGAHVLLVGSAEWTTPLADALETRVGATVETVTTADAALSVLDDRPVECVVSEYALDGRTGLELLRTIREGSPTLPVVLCTASGSEAVAVNDVNGAIFDPDGLDIHAIPTHEEQPEAVTAGVDDVLPNAGLLELDVGVLIPAAIGNVLIEANAGDVRADIVVEGANGPTTSAPDDIFEKWGVPVVPDILANAGGVTVPHFEWLQDINRRAWSLEEVNEELEAEMLAALKDVRTQVDERDVTWRDAAHIVARSRLADAQEARGLWP